MKMIRENASAGFRTPERRWQKGGGRAFFRTDLLTVRIDLDEQTSAGWDKPNARKYPGI